MYDTLTRNNGAAKYALSRPSTAAMTRTTPMIISSPDSIRTTIHQSSKKGITNLIPPDLKVL
jgi:hypothetical protein